jgi:hypothetical protein
MVVCFDNQLSEIKRLLYTYSSLIDKIERRNRIEYKCKYWDTYEEEHIGLVEEINNTHNLILDKCNDFLNYPIERFLFFDFTKKVKLNIDDGVRVLEIPFIDKREYYCLIHLLDGLMDIFYSSFNRGEYVFR